MNEGHIILFCRTPILGDVKKRIAATVGDQSALKIYSFLLNKTLKTLEKIPTPKSIFFHGSDKSNFKDLSENFPLIEQQGKNMGERMYHALKSSEDFGHLKNVLVGADIPDLETEDLILALKKLEKNDLVIGPAADGGYYLIGGKKIRKEVFEDIPWGSSEVFAKTMNKAKTLGLKVEIGSYRKDIDTREDALAYPELKKWLSLKAESVSE